MSNDLYNQKWQKFLKRIWLFQFIPFVDFVFTAGSLATGKVHEHSDFDVIIGVKRGRIFTCRAFCTAAYSLLGWRRKGSRRKFVDSDSFVDLDYASDKFCFSHFVTPAAYCLSPPYNKYWQNLYSSLVPVYGEQILIQKFWDANQDWMEERRVYGGDQRHLYKERGFIKLVLEELLSGRLGEWLEQKLKAAQIRRIKASLPKTEQYKPRLIYNDDELEFHPHTKRIEDFSPPHQTGF